MSISILFAGCPYSPTCCCCTGPIAGVLRSGPERAVDVVAGGPGALTLALWRCARAALMFYPASQCVLSRNRRQPV